MLLFVCSEAVESKLVKLDIFRTVILHPTGSVLFQVQATLLQMNDFKVSQVKGRLICQNIFQSSQNLEIQQFFVALVRIASRHEKNLQHLHKSSIFTCTYLCTYTNAPFHTYSHTVSFTSLIVSLCSFSHLPTSSSLSHQAKTIKRFALNFVKVYLTYK